MNGLYIIMGYPIHDAWPYRVYVGVIEYCDEHSDWKHDSNNYA